MNRHFQAKLAKLKNHAYYRNYCIDSNQILESDKDHQMPFVGGPNAHNKSKMANSCHIGKIEKSPYLSNRLADAMKFDTMMHISLLHPIDR